MIIMIKEMERRKRKKGGGEQWKGEGKKKFKRKKGITT